MEDTRFHFLAGQLPSDPACTENRVLLAGYIDRTLGEEQERRFREHLTECSECGEVYRLTLSSAARKGHALRAARKDRERSGRKFVARNSRFAAAALPPRMSRFRLQSVLIPAFLIFLLMQWGLWGKESFEVIGTSGSGEFWIGEEILTEEDLRHELLTGQVCRTTGSLKATLEGRDASLILGPNSQLLIEDEETLRLRLLEGEIEFRGPICVSTTFGILTSEGQGRLTVNRGVFALECVEGELIFSDSLGDRKLAKGDSLVDPRGGRRFASR